MKRDMDLIRKIALAAEDLEYGTTLERLDGVSETDFFQHVQWMQEAGLVQANITQFLDGAGNAVIFRLTWDGCEFADSVRDATIWRKAKDTVIKPTGSFTFGLLRDWLRQEIMQGLPTLRNLSQ
ncbi:DUF2513 domain-containing protein [Bordetella avium]|uniref:Phage protein n=1 Tax=Bordetella avium (strain 197N) TaxID=360910 RepID=Q2L2F0_BORA1|nr:DUF2513 domain-containing protein [Bordetella avium]RIQ47801.1 DUF2513 domain-containing protein [Bordetella avium]RIQ71029.1 DUF2513 domain-containing protein [Bordetella avium]CAJ49061.1 putative phage protein [Bordetella avium 197N]